MVSHQFEKELDLVVRLEERFQLAKIELDRAIYEVTIATIDLDESSKEYRDCYFRYVSSVCETYYNAIDRICFCYTQGVFESPVWFNEHKNLVFGLSIDDVSKDFVHIHECYKKWKEESE